MKQRICMAFTIKKLIKVMAALILVFPVANTIAAPCDIKNSPPPFIQHNLTNSQATSVSYCELCGFGYVTIVITNPYQGVDMTSMQVVENLGSSGLVYATLALAPTATQARYSINGGAAVSATPTITGGGSLLTWNFGSLLLPWANGNNAFSTLTITFPVISATSTTTPESLITATRRIQATLSYTTSPTVCNATITSPVSTPLDTLPLREPIPAMTKLGRNVDAAQGSGSYTSTVYGNINDDVIWRIRVRNTGMAALQDMMLSDLMQSGGMNVYYACSSEGTATTAATNLNALNLILTPAGAPPAPPAGCVSAGNTVNNFVVNNPFGTPNNDSPDLVDIPANGLTDIFLVGKIKSSCVANTTNTASNLQWGCTLQSPPGGITTTSTGIKPANSTATLSDLVGLPPAGLTIQRQLRGINLAQPVGSKGTMTITITNNTGGTIKNIKLRDVLPLEYVVDSTYTPTVVPSGGYGNYPGRTNTITWINPAPGTVPLTSTNPVDPLSNTQPQFTLTSSTVHPNYSDQRNMLRRGETLTINFRVILIKSSYYDRVANLDVHTESPSDGTDPNNQTTTLSNSLYLTYEDFCFPGVTRNAPTYPYVDNFTAFPEDLDIDINGTVFILTNDPAQPVTLPVIVTNHGGHDARDYHVFVSFGATMQVQTAPAGCSVYALSGSPSQPLPWRVWILPSAIPATATVYQCTPGGALPNPMAPGNSTTLNFTVIKTSDPTRIAIDDLSFRADVVGEITLSNGTPLWFPTPIIRADGQTDRANDYSLDGIRARVIGFNLVKTEQGNCSENNPPPALPDALVQIGEECTFHIDTGGWFGFQTPGFTYIAVQNINVWDQLPTGQGYISSTNPLLTSTSQIKFPVLSTYGSATPPVVLSPNWINWSLNPVLPLSNRITQLDEWFRVNVVTRMLNSALNASAPPNLQAAISSNVLNSTFEAVFADTNGVEKIFLLGSGTVGYPLPPARTVNLTVTEPNLTLVKAVCNETQSVGKGTSCSPFVALSNNGYSTDTYIYKITVSNGASASGVARAPAYDVVITDTLDPSDMLTVAPFATDALDNDGDGQTDALDLNGEGSISDNTPNNAIPGVITFSYTHSTALQKINPGSTVTLFYKVDPYQDVQPGQSFVNSATSSYDSLSGPSGAQTVVLSASGTTGGARVYSTTPVSATIQIALPTTKQKEISDLSQLNHVPTLWPSTQPVSIGEEIRYKLHTMLPISKLKSFTITDQLPVGIRCKELQAVNLSSPPYSAAGFVPGGTPISTTCTNTMVQWNFGDQALTIDPSGSTPPSPYELIINFIARVENTSNTNNGNIISNGTAPSVAKAEYINSAGTLVSLPYPKTDVQVQEPQIALTKTFSQATTDAADLVTVTVSATNNTAGYLATAYNLQVMDDLTSAIHLSYAGNITGVNPPTAVTVGKQTTFSWPAGDAIAFGQTRTFSYKILVDIGAQPLEVLSSNSINPLYAKWDSLPGRTTKLGTSLLDLDGLPDGLRNGTLTAVVTAPNTYQTSTSANLTVPAVTMSKTDLTPTPPMVPTIGAFKRFQVAINLPEGTTKNVVLTDALNTGGGGNSYHLVNSAGYEVSYTFEGIATINGVVPVNGIAPVAVTSPADNTINTATWTIGEIITQSEDDTGATHLITPRILITYYARIANDAITNTGSTLRNSATLTYTNGTPIISSPAAVTVKEPNLTMSKAVSNITSPGVLPDGGDVLEYTLTLNNTGNSTAYDINIVDTLPSQLNYYATFTPTATIGGVAVAGFVTVPSGAPAGPLVWGRNNADGSLDLPAGQTLIVKYRAIVQVAAEPNTVLSNSVYADWTSLDGTSTYERTGIGCPTTVSPNRYCVGPAVATTTVIDKNSITKAVYEDSYVVAGLSTATDSIIRMGDTVTYRLSVNLQEGRTRNVMVKDLLPAGMAFDSIVSINGVTSAPYTPPVAGAGSNFSYTFVSYPTAGQTGTVTWNFGTINNDALGDPTTDTIVIEYKVKALPVPLGTPPVIPQVPSTSLTNIATLTYTDGNGNASPVVARLTSSATITVLQPIISILTKTEATHATGSLVNTAGTLTFTLSACNTGLAPAYSVVFTDTLPVQFNNASITAPVVTVNGAVATAGVDYIYTPPPADVGTFVVNLNNIAINGGKCATVVYTTGFDLVGVNQSWNNQVNMSSYWSLPATSGQEYAGLGPVYFGMNNVTPLFAPTKTLLSSTGINSGEVVIGDEMVYRFTLPGSSAAATLFDVKITDTLNPALVFVSATASINGAASVVVTNSGTASNVLLNLGDVLNQAVVDIRVRVDNNASAYAGVLLDNTASYTYAPTSGGVAVNGGSATTILADRQKIVEPVLTLSKAVQNVTTVTNPAINAKAGDVLRYTLTLTAANGANNSNAYDISIIDTLSSGLAYVAGSAKFGGVAIADPTITGQVLSWSLTNDINKGTANTVTYDVLVLNSVLANQTLTNSAVAQWTSLNGVNANERNGSNSPAVNKYFTGASVTSVITLDSTIFTKIRLTDTYGAGDANVRIGDVVDFQLNVVLPEGTTSSVVLSDILPQGLQFESIVSVNGAASPYGSVPPFTYSNIATPTITGNPFTGPSTATWTVGNIVNAGDNNLANNTFVIIYRARVLNGALAQGAGIAQTLTNIATLNYTTATGAATKTSSASLNLQQPMLTVSKSSSPVAGSIIASGAIVTYTVVITNSGTAPAYDMQLRDIIPLGLRNGVATLTMVSTTLAGVGVTNVAPTYSATTGIATWNFDTGVANAYTIPAGSTMILVYTVQADTGLSAGLTMTNQAQVQDYCSFDNNAVPSAGSVTGVRQCYGVSNTATNTLITASANPLSKQNTQATAAIGDQFKYRITIPATVQTTALYDVRILDNLGLSVADMSYVGITQISGPAWTPVVTGAPKNLLISGSGTGLDIPAGQQVVFDITVVLNDNIAINYSGLTFQNTATYTYNQFNGDNATQVAGGAGVTANMTIVGPDTVTLQKTGPATMRLGVPGNFTLNVQNTGTGTAWDMTLNDILPRTLQGGMCDVTPAALTARMYLADGITPAGAVLVQGTDYTSSFAGTPTCTLTLAMKTAAAAVAPTNRLIVSYQAALDANTLSAITLTNIAGATQWFSGDTPANVATGQIHTYTGPLNTGTPGVLDNQDARGVLTESPLLDFRKTVSNLTTPASGTNAVPGDLLRYTITIKNVSTLAISNFSLTDELDRLNASAMFLPGSLVLQSIPSGSSATFTNATGGSKGTGIVDIRNLSIDAKNGSNDTLTIIFDARLAAVITNGTTVLNQAQLPSIAVAPINSDDPNVNGSYDPVTSTGTIDPTRTVITSVPKFQVKKTSQDITGDPLVLIAGDHLRYTISVKNIGNENASNVSLRDPLPANTTYVVGSTRLYGVLVADVGAASALQSGMLINAPENVVAGVMRADASATVSNVATITFEVQINSNVLNGTIISNQGFVNGSGLGSGLFPEKPSDDPATPVIDDPTLNVVGNFPLLIAQKVVAIHTDNNANGILDPLDVLRYTITINNLASIPATGVILTDFVPANTTYVADTVTLNGAPVGQPDGGISPLIAGIGVESPASPPGTIAAHGSAVITFDVQVNAGVATGTVISNQGNVTSVELPNEPTDADGNPSNGHQPTTIIVGTAQQITIIKQVSVVGGGAALAGGQLEYLVTVSNGGTIAASNVVITDNLSLIPFSTQVTYVAGSATLNGIPLAGSILSAPYGTLLPGATLQLRFRVTINATLPMGTTITNSGQVDWNSPTLTAMASVSIDVGGVPGSANLNGHVWHDANFDKVAGATELNLAGWSVDVYRNNILLGTALTDVNGLFTVTGLTPTTTIADQYALHFSAPGAVATTAKLGRTDSVYTNGLQQIGAIIALSGNNIQNLNLPITPNGVLYNSILRTPVTGAMLTMMRAGSTVALPQTCFDDPVQQGQITLASGYYKFDMNFSDPSCPNGDDYYIQTTSPLAFMPGQSLIIPPLTDVTTATFSVPTCPTSAADAIPATTAYCEAQSSEFAPGLAIAANTPGTNYYLKLALNNTLIPGHSQIFNNHIAIDPRLDNAVTITKVSPLQNVTKGQLVPYTITVSNTLPVTLNSMSVVDTFPPGFKFVAGSGRLDGQPVEPVATTRTLTWGNLQLITNTKRVIQLLLIVGSGVKEGKYVNKAQVFNTITNGAGSPEASATVRVIPDPTLDCSDVIGKVFDDANLNGYQDEGEMGLAGVRVVTARGLIVTTDKYGRFHLTCAVVPDPDRGSNFILKIDDRSLPSGYRITTENPRVLRATRGKMLKFNFGAAIHKIVKLDMADGVFEPGTTEMRVQWKQRVELLLAELKKAPSVLRLSYLAEAETEGLVDARIKLMKSEITKLWKQKKGNYDLTIETEVFWRTGSPPEKSEVSN